MSVTPFLFHVVIKEPLLVAAVVVVIVKVISVWHNDVSLCVFNTDFETKVLRSQIITYYILNEFDSDNNEELLIIAEELLKDIDEILKVANDDSFAKGEHEMEIIGNSGEQEVYVDYDANGHYVGRGEKNKIVMYKIR